MGRSSLQAVSLGVLVSALALPGAASAQVFYGQNDAGTANAAVTNARNSFLAALTGVGTESFEGFADNTPAPISLTFSGAGTATLTGTGQIETGDRSGANSVTGARYYFVETGGGGNEFSISFSQPIAAFGFFGRDLGDSGSNLILRFTRGAGGTFDQQVPYDVNAPGGDLASGNLLFYGFIDTANPFTSIQFRSTGSGDFFAFDDMTIGTTQQVNTGVVPEPGTYALLGTGLAGLAAVARRRRQQA